MCMLHRSKRTTTPNETTLMGGGGMDVSTRVGVVEGVVGTIKNTVRVKEIKNGLKEN